MTNNDILKRLRYAFDFSDKQAIVLFSSDPNASVSLSLNDFKTRLLADDESDFVACSDYELACFLDGLIATKRGLRESSDTIKPEPIDSATYKLSKNDVLKKLRIAMSFKEQQMLETLVAGGSNLSKSELGALFRNPQHKHYRACGNQVLRAFIKGLTLQLRV